MIYAVGGLKGGVGKTTFAMYLALYWARKNKRVLVLDADPISSSAFDWYEEARRTAEMPFDLEICPSNELDKILAVRWLDYDVVVVDCGGESAGVWTSTVRVCDHFAVVVAPKKAEVKKVKGTFDTAVDAIGQAGRLSDVTPHVILTRVKTSRDQGENPHNKIMREKLLDLGMPLLGHEVPDHAEYEDAVDTVPRRLGHYLPVFDEMHEVEEAA
ncbi:AAA family ATPase [Streptomyces sp. NPDC088785]|uniref:nucleotide-binding protein n=1 Tax=Streptomyces sp. NPDC088785 TaxID=3365897 RepID=UPI003824ADEE